MRDETRKKLSIGAGLSIAFVAGIIALANLGSFNTELDVFDNFKDDIEEKEEWHTEFLFRPLAENEPGVDTGGFMSIFLLDYDETPETVLANNATDWNTTGGIVHGYADYDGFSEDAVGDDPFYVVVRCCFNQDQAMSGGVWNASRTRVTITCSGDETISQTIQGNNTAETYGGGIESDNNSDYNKLYMNFYFDDNSDGYKLNLDGSLTVSLIKIEAKY